MSSAARPYMPAEVAWAAAAAPGVVPVVRPTPPKPERRTDRPLSQEVLRRPEIISQVSFDAGSEVEAIRIRARLDAMMLDQRELSIARGRLDEGLTKCCPSCGTMLSAQAREYLGATLESALAEAETDVAYFTARLAQLTESDIRLCGSDDGFSFDVPSLAIGESEPDDGLTVGLGEPTF